MRLHPQKRSRGFSLVELMVVISILSLIMALLLPAVQQSREAARRIKCQNNLRQLSLALHNYHSSFDVFPPGAVAASPQFDMPVCGTGEIRGGIDVWGEASGDAGSQGTSWIVQILPYFEQAVLYVQWDFSKNVKENKDIAQRNISILYCPSRRDGIRGKDQPIMFEQWGSGGTDYGACVGSCNGWHNCGAHESWMVAEGRRPGSECVGVMMVNSSTSLTDITDGTSNTLLLGELQRLDGGTDATTSRDGWAIGSVSTFFSSCSDNCEGINSDFYEEPGSDHPGGAHFSLADGSGRFFSETISLKLLRQLGSRGEGDGPRTF